MSSLRERTRNDGSTYLQVLWRADGKQRSRAFNTPRAGIRYQRILDTAGEEAAERDMAAPSASRTDWTVTGWVEHFIEHKSDITSGTRAEYVRMWRRTFGPVIGALPLDVLTRDLVSKAVIDLSSKPGPSKEPEKPGEALSYKSVKNARDLLATALADAAEQGVIPANPTRGVRIPRVTADAADDMRILTMDEWRLIEAEIPDYWLAILRLLVGTGMRVNEATALQVGSVNLEVPSVRISRGWKRAEHGWELGPPKTRKSVRTVELDPVFREILAPSVTGRRPDELLFTSRDGNRVHDGNLRSRVWQPACRRAGIEPVPTVHALRHTHASWLVSAGEDLAVVQHRLGHKSISTTIDVYTHLEPDTRHRAAKVAARAFAVPQITAGGADQARLLGTDL